MDTLFLSPGTPVTTADERAVLVQLSTALRESDPEVSLVYGAGLTQHEELVMSKDFSVRATKERLWVTANGHHIGDWGMDKVADLARFIETASSIEREDDDRY